MKHRTKRNEQYGKPCFVLKAEGSQKETDSAWKPFSSAPGREWGTFHLVVYKKISTSKSGQR